MSRWSLVVSSWRVTRHTVTVWQCGSVVVWQCRFGCWFEGCLLVLVYFSSTTFRNLLASIGLRLVVLWCALLWILNWERTLALWLTSAPVLSVVRNTRRCHRLLWTDGIGISRARKPRRVVMVGEVDGLDKNRFCCWAFCATSIRFWLDRVGHAAGVNSQSRRLKHAAF